MKHFAHPVSTAFCRTFLNPYFSKILYFKPPSSRSESTEGYWVCMGWRGVPEHVIVEQLDFDMQQHAEKFSLQDFEKQRAEERHQDQKWRETMEADMLKDVRTSMDLSKADTLASPLSKISVDTSSDAAR